MSLTLCNSISRGNGPSFFAASLNLRRAWCIAIIEHPTRVESQESNRYRFWGPVPELGGRYLRVVTLDDKTTIHNAFPDRGFTP